MSKRERGSADDWVIRRCEDTGDTEIRHELAGLGTNGTDFVRVGQFYHQGGYFCVASKYPNLNLDDVICCTMTMDEAHVAAILKPVSRSIPRRLPLKDF